MNSHTAQQGVLFSCSLSIVYSGHPGEVSRMARSGFQRARIQQVHLLAAHDAVVRLRVEGAQALARGGAGGALELAAAHAVRARGAAQRLFIRRALGVVLVAVSEDDPQRGAGDEHDGADGQRHPHGRGAHEARHNVAAEQHGADARDDFDDVVAALLVPLFRGQRGGGGCRGSSGPGSNGKIGGGCGGGDDGMRGGVRVALSRRQVLVVSAFRNFRMVGWRWISLLQRRCFGVRGGRVSGGCGGAYLDGAGRDVTRRRKWDHYA